MMRTIRRWRRRGPISSLLLAAVLASLSGLPGPALAEEVALLIGNKRYRALPWVEGADRIGAMERALAQAGFTVISGRDVDSVEMRDLVAEALAKADEGDRFIAVLSGRFVERAGTRWLLPVDARSGEGTSLADKALPLSVVLAAAAEHPARAVVALAGAAPPDPATIRQLPAAALVLAGPPEALFDLVAGPVAEGRDFAALRATAPSAVKAAGFASRRGDLAPREAPPDLATVREDAVWRFVRRIDDLPLYEKFLAAWPHGAPADEARRRIAWLRDAPLRAARTAEARLGLGRAERRRIQQDLTRLGHDTGGIDGIFGRGTRRAIRAWQAANGFEATGYLDAEQIALIHRQARDMAGVERAEDEATWQRTGALGTIRGLRRYLARYPDGIHAEEARRMLDMLEGRPVITPAERADWEAARRQDTIEGYRAYLDTWPEGAFAGEARDRIAALEEQAAEEARRQAEARERKLGLGKMPRLIIETRLAQLGHDPGVIDGVFDAQAREAIRSFQEASGITPTGYMDQQTMVKLLGARPR